MRHERQADTAGDAALRVRQRHVYWIGGGSGAGKTTIARRLADRYGLDVYATDDAMAEHGSHLATQEAPNLGRFRGMDMDDRWVNRTTNSDQRIG